MNPAFSNKRLLGVPLALAATSAVIFSILTWWQESAARRPFPDLQPTAPDYTSRAADVAPGKTALWSPPVAQSRGRDWIFDTFTPPEIFYHSRSKQFTVTPPRGLGEDEAEEAFGLELVSVRPEPFRLQLIGYVGDEGGWRGTFEDLHSGEVFLAAAGRRVPNLALAIVSLEVQPAPITIPESMTTQQRVAIAVVRDERTKQDVMLTHRTRAFTDAASALVAVSGQRSVREVRSGDVIKAGDATYRIERIQTTPASIDIRKESPSLRQPDRRALLPREAEAEENPAPSAGVRTSGRFTATPHRS